MKQEKNYIEYLKQKDNKKVISFADLNMLKTIKSNLESHKKANELLFNYSKTFEVHNEFHINWEFPNASELGDLSCKSLLDRVMIDHTNKKIILIDLKTTSHLYDFNISMNEFGYYSQLDSIYPKYKYFNLGELEVIGTNFYNRKFDFPYVRLNGNDFGFQANKQTSVTRNISQYDIYLCYVPPLTLNSEYSMEAPATGTILNRNTDVIGS